MNLDGVNFGPTEQSLSVRSVMDIAEEDFRGQVKFSILTMQTEQTLESGLLDLDSSLARTKLGWAPKWNQEEAIHLTFSWWKNVLSGVNSATEACNQDIKTLLAKS
jgi:CDP-glucose 4,6-dehydratase